MTAALVIIALVAASTVLGLLWRRSQGRVHRSDGTRRISAADLPGVNRLAAGATLLQLSTDVCAACVPTRALLGSIAAGRADVTHVDVDLTQHPGLARRFNVMQTPTTLILDRSGVVRSRIGGAPRRDLLTAELARILETP